MKKFLKGFEDYICALILLVMTLLTCINVFARYVLLSSMPFVEEFNSLGLVIISLAGATVAAKRGAHLGLTVLVEHLPEKAQRALTVFGHILGAAFGLVLLVYGTSMTSLERTLKMTTAGMQWPEWLFGIMVPISGAILIIRYLGLAIQDAKKKEKEED